MTTAPRKRRGAQAGITLVELLVAMSIMTILSTMLVGGWISLQDSFAFTQRANTARATVRDALSRMSSELRDCQPPTTSPTARPIQTASPYECVFYSSYNQAGARADGSGMSSSALRLTRLYLTGSGDQKTLNWQRDTDGDLAFTSADRTMVLAKDVVNGASTVNIPYVFTYGYKESGNYVTATSLADPSKIVSVQIRLAVDSNVGHSPNFIDMSTTVRPRNSAAGFLEEE